MYKKYIKRLFDIIISLLFIIIFFPLFIILFVLTKLNFKGKAIFKQERIGLNEKPYVIYKFKTMKDETKEITKFSYYLRKCGLDELPQLFNVLKGDMSFIGPRPFIVGEELPSMYSKERHSVRPGMSGLAQINGRVYLTHSQKLKYDDEYVKNINFFLDFKIFFKTIAYILKQILRR